MGIPILIFAVAFVVGAAVSARRLPDLADGRVGGLARLIVCGLLGIVVALVGLHVYEIVRQVQAAGSLGLASQRPDDVAQGLEELLRDAGPVLGLAAAVYLLAPAPEEEEPATG